MKPIRLVIAERRTLFRQGLAALLSADPDFVVVGEAADADEARRVCARVLPDLILLDAALPNGDEVDGLAAIAGLRVCCPRASLIVIGEAGDTPESGRRVASDRAETAAQTERRHALQLGAAAYVRPTVDYTELLRSLRAIGAADRAQEDTFNEAAGRENAGGEITGEARIHLTEREQAVIGLIAQGLCNKEIAHRLGISTQTVKNHVSHLLEKLALADRTQLAVYAITTPAALAEGDLPIGFAETRGPLP